MILRMDGRDALQGLLNEQHMTARNSDLRRSDGARNQGGRAETSREEGRSSGSRKATERHSERKAMKHSRYKCRSNPIANRRLSRAISMLDRVAYQIESASKLAPDNFASQQSSLLRAQSERSPNSPIENRIPSSAPRGGMNRAEPSPHVLKRMWPGGPLRQFSKRQAGGNYTAYSGPIPTGYAGSYICERCQRPCAGIYFVRPVKNWVCGPCKRTFELLENGRDLAKTAQECEGDTQQQGQP